MPGYAVTCAKGRVQSGETDQIFVPRASVNRRGVVLCHAYQSSLEYVDPTVQFNSMILAAAIASAGFACIAGDFGGDTLCNDTVVSRISAAWTALQSAVQGVKSDKVLLVGVSMGGGSAIRWAQANPTLVAALVGIIPLVDPNDVYQNNRASLQAPIGTAWGITFPTPLPTRGQLSLPANEALFTGPQQLWYSTADTTIIPSTVTAYAAATGATATVCDTTNGHGNASVGEVPTASVISFLETYA